MLYQLRGHLHTLRTPPVVSGSAGRLHFEGGTPLEVLGGERMAVVAAYSESAPVSSSLVRYVEALRSNGYQCVVAIATDHAVHLKWQGGVPPGVCLVQRQNIGHDFGTWAAVLNAMPPRLRSAAHVLLTNDSMVGPLLDLGPVLAAAENSEACVVVLTDSLQMGHSLQSYFMMFNGGVLNDRQWRAFFNSVRPQPTKMDVVYRYELRVSQIAASSAYGWDVLFPVDGLDDHRNPVIDAWRDLFERGFPFVKKTLWSDPELARLGASASEYLEERHGVNVSDWGVACQNSQG